ncbi:hypothetical protein N7541_003578 [Penicillium brevicompactum]|uniref:Uncharacterized protein n=1 Tax=Penicillium brevicompactum TaxID=5074 RepID=A0A9W9RPM9_PENBR|nr:hypothetical protein N7541_003578 [Penicillium brevicompactum]
MKFTFLAALALASQALSVPHSVLQKRYPSGSFSILAYGIGSGPLSVFYSDGLAYVGDASQWDSGSVTTDVTFTFNNTQVLATATNKDYTFDNETFLYIRPTANEVLPVGFTGNDNDTPDDAVAGSFLFYGTYLMWEDDDGVLSDSFRLKETEVSDIYQLYWDTSNQYPSGYLTPVIKSSV